MRFVYAVFMLLILVFVMVIVSYMYMYALKMTDSTVNSVLQSINNMSANPVNLSEYDIKKPLSPFIVLLNIVLIVAVAAAVAGLFMYARKR